MPARMVHSGIRLRGVRQNNLKNFDLDLPLRRLVVICGLSGSGKSSLAFETLFAEGQRRYVETFSPYARQFLDRMDKPQVDSIEGIPPAIAIEQRNTVKSTRSTVGTLTEICDYTKVFWPTLAQLYCKRCGRVVRKDSPQQIWRTISQQSGEVIISFKLALSDKLSVAESLQLVAKQGYQRVLLESRLVRVEDAGELLEKTGPSPGLVVVQDRVDPRNRARFVEACEQAYHFGRGNLAIHSLSRHGSEISISGTTNFSNRLHCPDCDLEFREVSSAQFSFNHPLGACPSCRGFGRIIAIDYAAAVPDWSKTLSEGVVKPWQTGTGAECQQDMLKFAKIRKVPVDVPFDRLPEKWRTWLIEGDPEYGKDKAHEWPRAWYGVKGYFRWLESKAYKMHVRVLLSRYRVYQTCPQCHGSRFQEEALCHRLGAQDSRFPLREWLQSAPEVESLFSPEQVRRGLTISEFYRLPVCAAVRLVGWLLERQNTSSISDPLTLALREANARLTYLHEVGLGYLSLDRSARTLSGGETERVNLTTCLGSRLVNTLFVLDEPSVGLHPRDTAKLVSILEKLREAQNTVLVVEHEPSVIRAADHIIEIGPGQGESGGQVVFQGSLRELLNSRNSPTGSYLAGTRKIDSRIPRPVPAPSKLVLENATLNNLVNLRVEIPLGRFVCVTGVSGSGKSTLVRDVLLPTLQRALKQQVRVPSRDTDDEPELEPVQNDPSQAVIHGAEHLKEVVLVDQSPLGRTPRSNPAVYTGAFDEIRNLFAQSDLARQRGFNASAFSFNSAQGQCQRCRGAGFEKIEMQFLSDVFIRCPECDGRRYRPHILEVTLPFPDGTAWSIADLLGATVDQTVQALSAFSSSRHALRAIQKLELLREVGLGYLRLGQPINTLSGGESQRLKLVGHLAEIPHAPLSISDTRQPGSILFMFDEPTTGLHFDDVRVLLKAFHRLVDAGHSILVIEHNLDVIKSADWILDLGPEAGEQGGQIVCAGTPDQIARCRESHTGRALAEA